MKYQVGDTVLILHSGEEAVITDIINHEMLMVDVKGVTFPVYMDQVDFPYFKRFTEKKIVPAKKERKYIDDLRKEKQTSQKRTEDGVWLMFLPIMDTDELDEIIVKELKLHLHNRTSLAYQFTYRLQYFGKQDFELKNTIQPFQDFYLHDIPFEDMNDSPSFEFDFALEMPDKKKAAHTETAVRMKPKQIFARIEELKQKGLASFLQLLFVTYPDRMPDDIPGPGPRAAQEAAIVDANKLRQQMEAPKTVVDLHIEKLTDDWKKMSNYEIMNFQLQSFEKYYQLAIFHHQHSLIVIHGVGEGVLRNGIHDLLHLKKEVKSFVNQYHPSYGYGATEIFFQY